MTQDDVLRDGAGRRITWDQFETWVVAQAIRNKLEMFHGGGASDPEDPDRDEGFITDKQMRAVNIVIRYTVHEALREMRTAVRLIRASRRRELAPAEVEEMEKAVKYSLWQLSMVHDYMEPPGSRELAAAYRVWAGQEELCSEVSPIVCSCVGSTTKS